MGVPPSILALFLLFHLLFDHSSGKCPDSFNCGTHGQIRFPLSNSTNCGLYTVQNCTDPVPKLNLERKEVLYDLDTINVSENSIRVNDPNLGDLIRTNGCDVFAYYLVWSLPIRPYISFTISPGLTLFKCTTKSPELDKKQDEYFRGNDSYRGCSGYTVYYKYPYHSSVSSNASFGLNCLPIELPRVSELGSRNASDVFSVLASKFDIRLHVSKACQQCRHKGGQCSRDITRFRCTNKKEGRSRLPLILGIVVSIVGIMGILLFCIIMKKLSKSEYTFFWKKKTENCRNIEAFLKNCGYLSLKRYTYSDIKKITNSFRTKLGQGGFGCVFKGKLENDYLVAVKVLKELKGNGEDFINEVATISRTSHVNIVTLLGFCFEGHHRALIYEFMPGGSLDNLVHDGGSSTYRQLGWDRMYQIAVGIARGLEYLHHSCKTRILHFDIKPHNILLDEDFCPKISDFGLAKLCPQKESIISLTGARGTAGYIAPEVFSRNFGGISHKSDVYSYGMMVLEMVGVRKNISVDVDCTSEIYFPHWVYKRLELDEELGLHGIMDGEANTSARKMIIVGLWCIQTDPSNRPSMRRVVEMLEGSVESLQIPPKPYLSSPSRAPVDSSTTHAMTL
ncbi:LEAF RUST 10 DISEASE-RESISTANCE LOCUS RECEPTOR-LIKE PROTEIN KINASE-like 2.4 isoform X2 [Rhododendron vialii]|uniref:LEAF RUST 10 DISEASE-RESISTANCE LOCUS RECEPTOR-LIKE PROTEIN KINASE-like 2.4 isoform X2 n=1 Tax=Rhododendron vialii TaxID=182163 RepID=UPI00265ED6F6|nr:LEAF RUST 10 DISEASE-RESISTANCE LOCUS RECEPTOR-LIKE PROTEIN KINASE-like 2.4 isoform X2 [Rhododendron vialii]